MYVRKADKPAFDEAVSIALLAVRSEVEALRDALPRGIYLTSCPDHLLDAVRKEVVNEILRSVAGPIWPPLTPDGP